MPENLEDLTKRFERIEQRVAVLDQRTVGLARKPHIKAPAQPTRATGSMSVNLSFRDLITLAENRTIEKDGMRISFSRPIMAELKKINEAKKRGEVVFYLDQTEPRRFNELE
jgi:hypothetical protein